MLTGILHTHTHTPSHTLTASYSHTHTHTHRQTNSNITSNTQTAKPQTSKLGDRLPLQSADCHPDDTDDAHRYTTLTA